MYLVKCKTSLQCIAHWSIVCKPVTFLVEMNFHRASA